mgnify:CR=1 FL=1
MPKFSCANCKNRHVNCHSTCKIYIKEKEQYAESKQCTKNEELFDSYMMRKKYTTRYKHLKKYGKTYL